jgi:hypothetical protein
MKTRKTCYGNPAGLPGNVIIFENPLSVYNYAPGLDIYRITDERLLDITLYFDLKIFMGVFNEIIEKALASRKRVLSIIYNPVLAKVVNICLKKYFSEVLFLWKQIAFFHDDETTKKIACFDGVDALEYKCFLLLDMLNYPLIQKRKIPYNALITQDYLSSLFV